MSNSEPCQEGVRSLPLGHIAHTIQIGVLDVNGLGGLVISRAVQMMRWSHEHFQHPLGEPGLKHHAAASHAHILTARIQVVDAHRDCRSEGKNMRLHTARSGGLHALPGWPCHCFFQKPHCPLPLSFRWVWVHAPPVSCGAVPREAMSVCSSHCTSPELFLSCSTP